MMNRASNLGLLSGVALTAILATIGASAADRIAEIRLAQVFVPSADGRDLPSCSLGERFMRDCHIHDRQTYFSIFESDAKRFPHAAAEYETWRRMYSAR